MQNLAELTKQYKQAERAHVAAQAAWLNRAGGIDSVNRAVECEAANNARRDAAVELADSMLVLAKYLSGLSEAIQALEKNQADSVAAFLARDLQRVEELAEQAKQHMRDRDLCIGMIAHLWAAEPEPAITEKES